ncbi:MAG: hypothetical protein V3T83_20450 [Acidobacteriota bacterium]
MRSVLAILSLLPLLLTGSPQPSRSTIEWPVPAAGLDGAAADSEPLAAQPGESVVQLWGSELELPPKPDRRFLGALGEITRFLSASGRDACQADAQLKPQGWEIRCGPEVVGLLSARADFSELRQLLNGWAERSSLGTALQKASPFPSQPLQRIDAELDRLRPGSLISALKRLDELWAQGNRHPSLIQRAARGLVLLTIQSSGLEDLNDPLAGRALAMLTLAGGGYALQNVEAEEALLAHRLGYKEHALDAASQLPADHPLRLYLQGSLTDLREAADRASRQESPLARYLVLRRLSEAGLSKDWAHWAGQHLSGLQMALPVLNSRPEGGAFPPQDSSVRERTLDLIRIELARAADDLNPGLEMLFPPHPALARGWAPEKIRPMLWQGGTVSPRQFESLLGRLESLYSGPFLDAPTLSSYFRSTFYLALYRLADRSLACHQDFPLDEPFLTIAPVRERPVQLQAWCRQQAEVRSSPDLPAPYAELSRDTHLEASGLPAVLESRLQTFPYNDQRLVKATQDIFGWLDSRPSHRHTRCRLRYILGLKALADGFRLQAAEWFESLDESGCGQAVPAQQLVQLARPGRLLALQAEQAE